MAKLLLGLYGPKYYGGFSPFLNWWKTANYPTITRTVGGNLAGEDIWLAGGYFDADTGEIVDPAPADILTITRIFFAPPTYEEQVAIGADFAGEQWVAEWDGSATAVFGGVSDGSQSNDGSNKRLMTMGATPSNVWLTLTLTDVNDPPRNIRVYQARYAANVAADETFNPEWLAEVRKFDTLRLGPGWMPTNDDLIETIADWAGEDYVAWAQNDVDYGPKSGMPLSVIVRLAQETGCKIHVCIPHMADDACVTSLAETLKAGVSTLVTYEYTNEGWNSIFGQYTWLRSEGLAIWDDQQRGNKFYGYRAAQCMAIIRNVYNDPSRWRGAICTQVVNTSVTDAMITGIQYWQTETSSPLAISDLFGILCGTGYFGEVQSVIAMTGCTQANPGVVTAAGHGFNNGDDVKLFVAVGMTELNDTYATVANKTTSTFELSGIDTTGFTAWSASGRNFVLPAKIFRLMDESEDKHDEDPTRYPTKYQYFNEQLADSLRTGTCDFGFLTGKSVATLRDTYWPAQKAIADTHGLKFGQYEGGSHFVGATQLSGFGGNPQFTEFLFHSGHSPEMGSVYAASYQAFKTLGGVLPAKFVEAGTTSEFGTWAAIRFWKLAANNDTDDTDNPVWQATLRANAGKRTITLT